ncbi:tetratricopeptide repeat protein [Striga asiatica]|uniref:Tetratricopeptide repeat protein n=1 Tax=Striga asiatica TaxID=4170 RepID=A0A5A7PY08_STRAF|nr:tetratricopeptide repeat protein [Striga asiatica]
MSERRPPSMAALKTDDPLSRRIARSFLHFLNSVEPSAGVDSEALDVARECLSEVFKIDQSSISQSNGEPSLVDIFSLQEANADRDVENRGFFDATSSYSGKDDAVVVEEGGGTREPHSPGKDELFGKLFGALEKIHYFRRMSDGTDDQGQLDRTTHLFHYAVKVFKQLLICCLFVVCACAGNKLVQSKRYDEAVELYTFAVALCEGNAVYYCNRAAAYTQLHRYAEAIQDCLKSIEINPHYSKAYSRLGFAYYSQGRYRDAIDEYMKGWLLAIIFLAAHVLDPNNTSIKENVRAAVQKLNEEGQSSTSTNHQPQFPSMPFNISGDPPHDFTDLFRNFVPQDFQGGPHTENNNEQPGIRMDGSVNFNFNQLPEELSGAFRSMMGGMFPGGAPPPPHDGNQQDNNHHGRPASS